MKRFLTVLSVVLSAAVCGALLFGCASGELSDGLTAPCNLQEQDYVISWDAVAGASEYSVELQYDNGKKSAQFKSAKNSLDYKNALKTKFKTCDVYTVRVKAARGEISSEWSDPLQIFSHVFLIGATDFTTYVTPYSSEWIKGDVVIPAEVESIEAREVRYFNGNDFVTSYTLSEGLQKIDSAAFSKCPNLTKAVIPSTVTEIAGDAFSRCPKLTELIVDEDNKAFKSDGNCIIRKSDNMLIAACENSVVPDYISGIGDYAFRYASFTEFEIPPNVKTIGCYAFANSNLNSIVIPSNVERVGSFAFDSCLYTEIIIHNGVKQIGEHAFSVPWRSGITLPEKSISVTLPDSVISYDDFIDCQLYNNRIWDGFRECTIAYDDGVPYVVNIYGSYKPEKAIPRRAGYIFEGWATEENGEAVYKKFMSPHGYYVSLTKEEYEALPEGAKLYAVWQKI